MSQSRTLAKDDGDGFFVSLWCFTGCRIILGGFYRFFFFPSLEKVGKHEKPEDYFLRNVKSNLESMILRAFRMWEIPT